MCYSIEERKHMAKLVRKNYSIKFVADIFEAHRNTVSHWSKQDLRTVSNIRKANPNGKITLKVELAIIEMRMKFKWGTARIKQGLINLPDFMKNELDFCVQEVYLSRTSVNNILKKHNLNGYKKRRKKAWKFFRAKYKNELWQIDLKEFKFEGKKYYISVVIDDYSRYIISLTLFDHCPTTKEITAPLQKLSTKPKKILADNGQQFKKQWEEWCKNRGIEAIFAHPYYPQDKGKVERTIRNLAEEFINLLGRFKHWINGKMEEWRIWFNEKRYHNGVKDFPANLYAQL